MLAALYGYAAAASDPPPPQYAAVELDAAPRGLGRDGARFGERLLNAGDVNGDGVDDLLVGAPDDAGGGTVLFYPGRRGLGFATAAVSLRGGQDGAAFGFALAALGDVNEDGFGDFAVGAPRYDNGQFNEGAVWVFAGAEAGPVAEPLQRLEIDQVDAGFGAALSAGDVDGDGRVDLIVGARFYDVRERGEGAAFVFHGRAGGVDPRPRRRIDGDQPGAFFGESVAALGDADGDGFGDVAVASRFYSRPGAVSAGAVFVYRGGRNGLAGAPARRIDGERAGALFGSSLAAGDADGDGRGDLLIGAPGIGSGGSAYLYPDVVRAAPARAPRRYSSEQGSAQFGGALAIAGAADGGSLLLIGAPAFDAGVFRGGDPADELRDAGAVFAYRGTSTRARLRVDGIGAGFGLGAAVAGFGGAMLAAGAPTAAGGGAVATYRLVPVRPLFFSGFEQSERGGTNR